MEPPLAGNLGVSVTAGEKRGAAPDEDAELLVLAHTRFQLVCSIESNWRRRAEQELDFTDSLIHWTAAQLDERRGRPSLTFDKIGPSIDQVVNDARQNPPEPRISPVGSGGDKDTAQIIQGLIRNIDNDSCSDVAFMTGYEHAVKVGRGWWRVDYQFENDPDPDSDEVPQNAFWQKILVNRISNLFSVYPDPATEKFDYSDMRYCFVTEDLDETIFKEQHPHSKAASGDFSGVGDDIKNDWFPKGCIRVAEYWWIEVEEDYICQLPDRRIVKWDQVPAGVIPVNTRKTEKRKVKYALLSGNEILERRDHPGRWIPLIPCLGREIREDKKRAYRGMIRPAMDANLSYDYMRSKQVEAVALAPLAPWQVYEGQIDGYEEVYTNANRKATPYLIHKLKDAEGNTFPAPPMRQVVSPEIQAMTVCVQQAAQDCESQLSTYAPSLGAPSPEASGRAIMARQREGDNAHFNYHDNLARAIRHTGRVIVDLIPHIYSEERTISIYDPDGASRIVPINQVHIYQGAEKLYNLVNSAMRYDVVIGSGPSYATKRQQGVDAFLQLVQAVPEPMMRALDLGVRMMDIPMADKIADRLRPPDIAKDQDDQAPLPPQAMQAIQQQGKLIELLTGEVHRLTALQEKQVMKLESDERRTAMQSQTQIIVAEINAKMAESQRLVDIELEGIKQQLNALHAGTALDQEAMRLDLEYQQAGITPPPASPASPAGAPSPAGPAGPPQGNPGQ